MGFDTIAINLVDCVLGEWIIPTCRASCGSSRTVTMTRPVITPSANGGKACGDTSKSHTCYGASCPVQHGGCYSNGSIVTLSSGLTVKMNSLKIGDMVEVTDEFGVHGFSEFVGWMEKEASKEVTFYKLTTESGNVLIMTGKTFIVSNQKAIE